MGGYLPNGCAYSAVACGGRGLNLRHVAPKKNEQAPFGPGMLHRDLHELLDQLGEDNLARDCVWGIDDGLDIQLRDRRAYCRGSRSGKAFLVQARVAFVELLPLAECAPAFVAIPRFA